MAEFLRRHERNEDGTVTPAVIRCRRCDGEHELSRHGYDSHCRCGQRRRLTMQAGSVFERIPCEDCGADAMQAIAFVWDATEHEADVSVLMLCKGCGEKRMDNADAPFLSYAGKTFAEARGEES
jgi:hypothetical protein